jgi:hypothetical protein
LTAGRLLAKIRNGFALVMDLHANRSDLAHAAEEGGVDAIAVQINGEGIVGGGEFGSFELEEPYLREVRETVSLPVGINIGAMRALTPKEWEAILSIGFDFVTMYAHDMPLFVLGDNRITKIAAVGSGYLLEQIRAIAENRLVDAVEMAYVSRKRYGTPLDLLDLSTVSLIAKATCKPILLPTQKAVKPEHIAFLKASGCRGLVLNRFVAGTTPESYERAARWFRTYLDAHASPLEVLE